MQEVSVEIHHEGAGGLGAVLDFFFLSQLTPLMLDLTMINDTNNGDLIIGFRSADEWLIVDSKVSTTGSQREQVHPDFTKPAL